MQTGFELKSLITTRNALLTVIIGRNVMGMDHHQKLPVMLPFFLVTADIFNLCLSHPPKKISILSS